jgi:hypothetical protein
MASDTGIENLIRDLDFVKQLCRHRMAVLPEFDLMEERPFG